MNYLVLPWMTAGLAVAVAAEHPCGKCHPAEEGSQPGTSMAHALQRAADSRILKNHPVLRFSNNGFTYAIRREGESVEYSVEGGGRTFSSLLPWAFGLGSAGQTYLYKIGGDWYESRVSFYSALNGLDITIGHRSLPADNRESAAGRKLQKSEAEKCFGCHAGGTLDAPQPGVQCERCHENSSPHARAFADRSVLPVTPERLGQFDAEQMADFCGGCHRTWQEIAANGPHDINNVRLQPYRLVSSKCYESSFPDKRISCVACHDPHREVVRTVEFYDARCQACHTLARPPAKACPKAVSGCTGCHMPKIDLPEAHFRFTDHRIRIVHPGEPYPS